MTSNLNIHPLLFNKSFLKVFYKERNGFGKWNLPKQWHLRKVNSFFSNLQPGDIDIDRSKIINDLVVSLTLKPGREKYLDRVIKSILINSVLPYRIVLWIARDEFEKEKLPEKLLNLRSDIFEIHYTEDNLRSYNKLLPALKLYPDYRIVTADDDILYPIWWLEELIKRSNQYPNEIIGYRCLEMKFDQSAVLAPYIQWHFAGNDQGSINYFATGVSGVCYPPGCFTQEVLNESLINSLCPTADDVWFKIQSLLHGISVRPVFSYSQHFPLVSDTQQNALQKINKAANDLQLKKLFEYYGISQESFLIESNKPLSI